MKLISRSVGETVKIAAELARKIVKSGPQKHAVVVALEGELGAGKTIFVKAFARALGIKAHITSPTFVLLKAYKPTGLQAYRLLVHIDAYRLKNYRGLLSLGVKEVIAEPTNIILVEWSERVKPILPRKHIKVHIDHINETTRQITTS